MAHSKGNARLKSGDMIRHHHAFYVYYFYGFMSETFERWEIWAMFIFAGPPLL